MTRQAPAVTELPSWVYSCLTEPKDDVKTAEFLLSKYQCQASKTLNGGYCDFSFFLLMLLQLWMFIWPKHHIMMSSCTVNPSEWEALALDSEHLVSDSFFYSLLVSHTWWPERMQQRCLNMFWTANHAKLESLSSKSIGLEIREF